ncbi:MAG: hypothetical protein ACD_63C00021G0002 [uncultured bacterium]|nr:MAG: hypothetical protein ACD_63C00021G0002 [uncultured bacterium]
MAYKIASYVLGKINLLKDLLFTKPVKVALNDGSAGHFELVRDLLRYPEMVKMSKRAHHKYHSKLDHMLLTSKFAYYFAQRCDADIRTCTRASVIHDVGTHWYHNEPAVRFARRIGEPEAVQNAIDTHMVFNKAPKTKEGWVVAFADGCAWGVEALEFLKYSIKDLISWIVKISPVNIT